MAAPVLRRSGCDLFMGTCGFSFGEWVDAGIYPKGTGSADMLAAYTRILGAAELNYTWYQMPRAETVARMAAQVPQGFKFAAKLTRTLTHEIHKTQWIREAFSFRQGIGPLADQGMLLAVLIQLPPYFTRTPDHRAYLAALLDELAGLPLAVEFRHASWALPRVAEEFARRRVTLVSVDGPDLPGLFPRLTQVTNPGLFYLRLHGRNSQGWRSGNMQKQFDYDYGEQELRELAQLILQNLAPEAEKGAVFFNNHVRGQAPKNCLRLIDLITRAGRP